MFKGYKYRIYPTKEQCDFINQSCGASRFVYNWALRTTKERSEAAKAKGEKYFYDNYKMSNELTALIHMPEVEGEFSFSWLSRVDADVRIYALLDLANAFKNIKKTGAKYPVFKKRGKCTESYTTGNRANRIRMLDDNHIKLPKMGSVKIVLHRPIDGVIKAATISRTPTDKYYVSLRLNIPDPEIHPTNEGGKLGVHMGLSEFYSTSAGTVCHNPRFMSKMMKRLKIEQRKLSHIEHSHITGYREWRDNNGHLCRKPIYDRPLSECRNYQKQRLRVAKVYEKIANQRKDFQNVESLKLAEKNSIVCMETLDIKSLTHNNRLSRHINDAAWYQFKSMVSYKMKEHGGILVELPTEYPSAQTCSKCGYKNPIVKDLSIRKWVCPKCATLQIRGINAGTNLLQQGLKQLEA